MSLQQQVVSSAIFHDVLSNTAKSADRLEAVTDLNRVQPIYEKLDESLAYLEKNPNQRLSQEQRTRLCGQLREMGQFVARYGSEDAYLAVSRLEASIKEGQGKYDAALAAEVNMRQDYSVTHMRRQCQFFVENHIRPGSAGLLSLPTHSSSAQCGVGTALRNSMDAALGFLERVNAHR